MCVPDISVGLISVVTVGNALQYLPDFTEYSFGYVIQRENPVIRSSDGKTLAKNLGRRLWKS